MTMTSTEPSQLVNLAPGFEDIKALLFDVFGTVVDWRTTVVAELIRRAESKQASPDFGGLSDESSTSRFQRLTAEDWATFAQEWRNSYGKFTRSFVPGVTEWKDIDTHHHESLLELLSAWGISGIYDDDEARSISLVWHYLKPWDDSSRGLQLLGTRFVTSTLSNGNHALLEDLNEHGKLGFQRIISSADFKAYKPNPKTYLGAAKSLGVEPHQCTLVAAHLGDLKAARSHGFKTIYVERFREETWGRDSTEFVDARTWVDIWVSEDKEGFIEVARRLGVA
jgi:2-haloacid dehalogenase